MEQVINFESYKDKNKKVSNIIKEIEILNEVIEEKNNEMLTNLDWLIRILENKKHINIKDLFLTINQKQKIYKLENLLELYCEENYLSNFEKDEEKNIFFTKYILKIKNNYILFSVFYEMSFTNINLDLISNDKVEKLSENEEIPILDINDIKENKKHTNFEILKEKNIISDLNFMLNNYDISKEYLLTIIKEKL